MSSTITSSTSFSSRKAGASSSEWSSSESIVLASNFAVLEFCCEHFQVISRGLSGSDSNANEGNGWIKIGGRRDASVLPYTFVRRGGDCGTGSDMASRSNVQIDDIPFHASFSSKGSRQYLSCTYLVVFTVER